MIPLLLACTRAPAPPAERPGPDLLIYTVDTLRHDRLGFAGHQAAQTPHMDALAARGVVFEQATTPFPRTTPALASMLTGLRPAHHGSLEVGQPITHGTVLAHRLQQLGWATLGLSGTPVAGAEQGLDAGFQVFVSQEDPRASALVERALSELRAQDPEQPVMMWVHVVDPHFPYLPPDASEGPCKDLGWAVKEGRIKRAALFVDHQHKASAALDHCLELYDGEVTEADTALGDLLAGFEAAGRDPIVVLSSDHGEHFGEGGLYFEHGPRVDDAVVRVPLVVAGPGVRAGRDAGVARLEDIAATLLGRAGIQDVTLDGVDLWPRLSEGVSASPDLEAWVLSGSALHNLLVDFVVSGRQGRRVCHHGTEWTRCVGKNRAPSFFHHAVDPLLKSAATPSEETRALLESQAQRWPVGQARQVLVRTPSAQLRALPQIEGGYAREGDQALTASLDRLAAELEVPTGVSSQEAEVIEGLKAMGYVE